jgi:SpoVK/Ycf46/Vps4 family AAA+-type ATPase
MGVLLTGPSGSGKAALVEVVAHDVGARLLQLWGPQLAATEANAAAEQVVDTLARATRSSPAVVLLADVQAVAPREGAGPLLPALLAAVREAVAAGRVAVVCTTSHPERVTPQLRTPGTLDHELAVPLPDRRTRLRQLEVATRSLPLAEDVALDEVAGRTPGFVAEDLLALVREAGLRAAARQRDSARRRWPRPTSSGRSRSSAPPRWRARRSTCPRSRWTTSVTWPRSRRRSPRRCCGRWTTPTPSPASASPRRAGCCCTARPAAARRSSSRRSPAPARPTCCR